MKKKLLSLLLLLTSTMAFSQGEIKGFVYSSTTGATLEFANITLEQNGTFITGTSSNLDGYYSIDSLDTGTYNIKVSYTGFEELLIKDVIVNDSTPTVKNLYLNEQAVELKSSSMIIVSSPPLQQKVGNTTIRRESMRRLPVRDANSISATSSGVYKSPNGNPSFKGSRADRTVYYVDGIKVPSQQVYMHGPGDDYTKINENTFKNTLVDPLSTFSLDVDRASYSNVRSYINNNSLPPADAVRVEEMINYFEYDYAGPENDLPFAIHTEVTQSPWNTSNKIVHIGVQSKKIANENLPPSNLTFLIDVSGSMDSPNKLPLVKSSLTMLVKQMRPEDRIAILVYANATGMVLESTPGDKKEKILNAINNLSAGGSTAGGAGIQLAYKIAKENFNNEGNNRVILCTDGDFNVGMSSNSDMERLIEEKRKDDIFLTVLGYGMGNYKDSKLEILADKGNGNYAYIDDLLEANKVLVKEMGATLVTLAKDTKVQIEFNPKYVKEYRLVGYENRMLNTEDFDNDKVDAGDIGAGHTVTAIYEIIPAEPEVEANKEPLKYQQYVPTDAGNSDELLTVKIRYKDPKDTISKKVEHAVLNETIDFNKTSENLRFSIAVASYSMLLRNSAYTGKLTYNDVLKMAKDAKGKDEEGYRAEFIKIIKKTQLIKEAQAKQHPE